LINLLMWEPILIPWGV
jgi:Fibronectin type III domain.